MFYFSLCSEAGESASAFLKMNVVAISRGLGKARVEEEEWQFF